MGRPSQEYVDNSIKRLEEDRQKGVTTQVMERAMPIAADVWNIGFEAMPERMYSGITGIIPESVPYIGGGGERAIETRRILDERSKQGKQIVEQFGATSPENLQFVYDTEKILEKRFEERPWWQEIGTSFFNPLDWLLGAGIGKGVGAGIRGVKALRGTSLAKGALKPPIREPNVDFMPSWYRNIPETDLRKITDDIPTPPITQPTTQALAVIPPIAKVARPLQQGVMDIADPTLYPIPLPAQTPSTQLQQAAEGLGREMGEGLGIRPTQQQLLPGQRAIDIAEQQRLPFDLTYKGEAWTPPARPGQIIDKAPDIPLKKGVSNACTLKRAASISSASRMFLSALFRISEAVSNLPTDAPNIFDSASSMFFAKESNISNWSASVNNRLVFLVSIKAASLSGKIYNLFSFSGDLKRDLMLSNVP